jgi:hypothetical protein
MLKLIAQNVIQTGGDIGGSHEQIGTTFAGL